MPLKKLDVNALVATNQGLQFSPCEQRESVQRNDTADAMSYGLKLIFEFEIQPHL
jgi:hypothetical protein